MVSNKLNFLNDLVWQSKTLLFITTCEIIWWLLLNASEQLSLRENCPNAEFSLGCIFPYFDWNQKIRTRKNSLFGHFSRSNCGKNFCRKQPAEVICKKGVYKNFANFTGKHLCRGLFLMKNIYSTSAKDCFCFVRGFL